MADLALYFVASNAIGLLILAVQGAIDEEALFPAFAAVAAGLAGGQLGGHRDRPAPARGRASAGSRSAIVFVAGAVTALAA